MYVNKFQLLCKFLLLFIVANDTYTYIEHSIKNNNILQSKYTYYMWPVYYYLILYSSTKLNKCT